MNYQHSIVVMEGMLDLERLEVIPPITCDKKCKMNQTYLCGWAKRKDGATSFSALEMLLEKLNGKQAKVTVEWDEKDQKSS